MREILFRAKHKEYNQWVEGDLIHEQFGECIQFVKDGCRSKVKVDPETVCQYTGLTDKNGRKIFEGDIISFDYELGSWGRMATVLFEDGEYRYRTITNAADLYNCRICGENDRCEVIGNIFENPELIGEQP